MRDKCYAVPRSCFVRREVDRVALLNPNYSGLVDGRSGDVGAHKRYRSRHVREEMYSVIGSAQSVELP